MKRIIMMVLRNLIFIPGAAIKLLKYAAHPDRYSEEVRFALLKLIVNRAVLKGNITIVSTGEENIPKENGFMYYPNHQGMFDVLALVHTSTVPFTVVAKKEAGNIPFLKQVLQCMKAHLMDREDLRQSMQVIQAVTKEVKEGKNATIFAEGTRSKMGNKLLEFKGGSFKAATKAKCPIVPVALMDSYKAFDTNTTEQITIQVHYLKPLVYEEYKDMKTVEIAEKVKSLIEETIAEYEK